MSQLPPEPSAAVAANLCRATIESGGAVALIPGLLGAMAAQTQVADAPLLCRMLALGSSAGGSTFEVQAIEQLLINCLQPDAQHTCAAGITYSADFGVEPKQLTVMRADPAYQQIDINNAILSDPQLLQLETAEVQALIDSLNQHFINDKVRLEYKHPQRWFCHFDSATNVTTIAPGAAIGRDVAACRPTGADSRQWRRYLAEIEMLLYDHPVNVQRQTRGLLPVNTLWLWGEGTAGNLSKAVTLCGDEYYLQSLAAYAHVTPVPQSELATVSSGPLVISAGSLTGLDATASIAGFKQCLKTIETELAQPLWAGLKSGRWSSLLIWTGDSGFFMVPAAVSKKFWQSAFRKPAALATYVAPQNPNDK